MRKLILLIGACLCMSFAAMADQLEYMSEEQAKAAVKLLQKQKYVLLYCSNCPEDYNQKVYVKLESVSYRYTDYMDFYEVVVEGIDSNGNKVSETIDLAYAYIMKKKNGYCICEVLKYDCSVVEPQVKWECAKF